MATVNPVEDVWGVAGGASLLRLLTAQDLGVEQIHVETPEQLQQALSVLQAQLTRLNNLMGISHDNFQTLYGNDGNVNTGLAATQADLDTLEAAVSTTVGTANSEYTAGSVALDVAPGTTLASVTFTTLAVPYFVIGVAQFNGTTTGLSYEASQELFIDSTSLHLVSTKLTPVAGTDDFILPLTTIAVVTPTAASHTFKITGTDILGTWNATERS